MRNGRTRTLVRPTVFEEASISTALGLLAVVALIAANAFFVAVEFALVAVDRARVEQQAGAGRRAARTTLRLLRRLSFHLSGAQLGITISSLVLGFVAEPTLAATLEPAVGSIVGDDRSLGVSIVIALVIATVVQMVMGELVPKSVAIARPLRVAYALSGPMHVWGVVTGPIVRFLNGAANATVRRLGLEPREELASVRSLEELEFLIQSSGEEGTLDEDALALLTRSLRLTGKTAAEALVPRPDVVGVTVDGTVGEVARIAAETGHSRFPVHRGDLDDVVGVVHAKGVFSVPYDERRITPLTAIMGEAFFVPEARELGSLLLELRDVGTHLAVVVDEYGGTEGIITLEDILEEIVGEIDDEYDASSDLTSIHRPGVWELDGSLHADEVFDTSGFTMPDGPYETLAGFVVAELGRIANPGDVVEHDGWTLEVIATDRLRVAQVRLTVGDDRPSPPGEQDGAAP